MTAVDPAQLSAPQDGLPELIEMMAAGNLAPLWQLYERLVVSEPQHIETSFLWRWPAVEKAVQKSARAVTGALADHRVLLLQHPGFVEKVSTTSSLLAAVQCVLPGERTQPHRHTASTLRFVIESADAVTYVGDTECRMQRGDLVLTPNWALHWHANTTNARAVWLDMLDLPLTAAMRATFAARGSSSQPAGSLDDSGLRQAPLRSPPPRVQWSWAGVVEELARASADRDGSRSLRYVGMDGGAITPTLDVRAVELPLGRSTTPCRTSASTLYVVIDGEGQSRIGESTHTWSRNDVFTVPNWTWHSHRSASECARLLVVSDCESYRRLGFLRDQVGDTEN